MEDRFLIDYDTEYKTEFIIDLEKQERLYTHDIVDVAHALSRLNKEINELRMENKQLKLNLRMFKSVNEFINNYGIEKAKEVWLQSEKTKTQSQNSKAIEVLEKVKNDIILNIPEEYGEIKTLPNGYSTYYIDRPTVITFINNQIAELRGKNEQMW